VQRQREINSRAVTPESDYDSSGDERIAGESHPIARMILIGVAAAIVGTAITLYIDWFPEPADTAASKIDTIYDVLLIASVPIFVLVMTVAIYSVWKFRAKPGDMSDGAPIHGNTRLEIIWVTIPFLMVTGLAIYGWVTLNDIEAKQPDELVVSVTGRQFTWTFGYPSEDVRGSSQLVLPENRPVEFRIHTEDVIHSFWVPQFRLKSDAVPGITTKVRLTPNRTGNFEVVCTELCGLGHATMRNAVHVVPQREFQAWLDRQKQAAGGGGGGGGTAGGGGGGGGGGPDGKEIFASSGCGGCHTLADAGAKGNVGPSLDEIPKANLNETFIKQSITDPSAKVTKGFPDNVMPKNFGDQLSPEEIDALVKYLLDVSGGKSK
jgi:cytochrome c oxidase subunit 2